MDDEKFAFEFDEVSIAFVGKDQALGDTIIYKAVFDAILRLVPNCKVDIFYTQEKGKNHVKAFYAQNPNLNRILSYQQFYVENMNKYDVALRVWYTVFIEAANVERLKKFAPALLQSLLNIVNYNKTLLNDGAGHHLRNITRAHIFELSRYTALSCGGALPIYDNHVKISLTPEGKRQFQELGLNKKYITVGSNLIDSRTLSRFSLKEWPNAYATEYISLLNMYAPQIEVVQVGGGGVYKFANADRHIFDADLELVKYILKNSLLHVDCESGLVHLATQLGTKCLVLFGPTDEKYFGFKENLNLASDVCRPCCFAWDNGTTCLRGAKEPPCMAFSPQLVCEVTCNYINHLDLKNNA